ncbi:MAG: hypothetical protein J6V80_04760 [Clostridia bacterium]|nr:hypothetical protein [Clostridia bacterium]
MRRFPWGILTGIFAMIWSFALIAIIAVFVVSSMMYVYGGGDDGLRDSWWIMPLIVTEIISAVGCGASLILRNVSRN